jgi:RNA recognition motif-containing protein
MHTKVFVGNLSFKTKASELASEFTTAGRVVSANIITRGPRSLGYGFVELETEEEASKAVALLNKRSVDGREINVELAKPRDETKIAERRQNRGELGGIRRGPRRGGRGGGRGGRGGFDNNNENPSADNSGAPKSAPRGDGGDRGEGGRGGRGGGRPYRRPYRGGGGRSGDSSRRRGGPPMRNRDLSNRNPSPTTLFVANLPFALDDAGLSNLFKDLKVSKAHVVKNRNGRSKGFGFVEFNNEADQKAALTASEGANKLVVDARELVVKIALTVPENKENAAAPNTSSSSAPAVTPSADASATKEAPKTDAAPKAN